MSSVRGWRQFWGCWMDGRLDDDGLAWCGWTGQPELRFVSGAEGRADAGRAGIRWSEARGHGAPSG
jgi:hypothetical protein